MPKLWKQTGVEQKVLENLFRSRKINLLSKPKDVQFGYRIFQGFSPNVFRYHFNKTKKDYFKECKLIIIIVIIVFIFF